MECPLWVYILLFLLFVVSVVLIQYGIILYCVVLWREERWWIHAYILFAFHPHCLILTHWGQVTHIYVSRLTITGSVNGLSPGRRQAIIWTNAGILLIGPLGTNFSDNSIKILAFSFTKNAIERVVCEIRAILFRPLYVKNKLFEFKISLQCLASFRNANDR